MGRFGAVSYRQVKQSEADTIEIDSLKNGDIEKYNEENDKISRIPLAQLSINKINGIKSSVIEELSLKRPSYFMATKMIKSLLPYYWKKNPFKFRIILCVSIIFFSKLINLSVPLIFKNIINTLPEKVEWHLLILYGVLFLIQKSIWDIRDLLFQDVNDSATKQINLETFDHLHRLSLSYHLNKRTGSLIKIVERGTSSVVQLLSLLLFNIFPTLVELFTVSTFLLFSYGAEFAFINLTSCVVYIAFTLYVTERRTKHRRLANKKENEASDIKVDSLMNFETIKYFTAESYERKRYDFALMDFFQTNKKSKVSYFLLNFGQSSIIVIGTTLGLGLATWRASQNGFTLGDVIAINTFIAQMFSPLSWLGSSYRMILTAFTDMENLFELLDTQPEVSDSPNAKELNFNDTNNPSKTILPSIEFRNISFTYPNKNKEQQQSSPKILDNISFTVPAGKSIALVGSTGGGKSTIFRLLCRFYDVDQGEILINGENIKDVTQTSLRSIIGVVPQETVLFNDTVAYNIGFGNREANDDQLIDASRRAQILSFIESSPDGFRTVVGERGLRLSGGEKQRVSIARALLKDPPILILDEASSSLDTFTERKIQQAINEVSKGRTTLVIAHRLSTIIHCDEILVLKGGHIVERGSHSYLLDFNGDYAHLWNQQQLSASDLQYTPNQDTFE
ncbi:ABC transporter B family protein [Dictyostelium discoideum AX4]|uniref:ABC transporter B family member 6 n=1 Tax=Dictyostelium discoideum TaxID=44689 RepID=ABCB6_DICDI|nr:ABC transporter B family protein [Dictyostelium discoideum AX4]Q54RU1.1 RecName: Full=ABC transporter B family member 6; AltName: Full=ABC transporter ABCB.6 [Dictyostelium discoideum]EAL65909.1 ABC transporter B family protein [Dictyostelium discoideum AX4]|eukprot:XP_639260.1 ABC transporter B family protein [Dictyostelium discoideum AX4]